MNRVLKSTYQTKLFQMGKIKMIYCFAKDGESIKDDINSPNHC